MFRILLTNDDGIHAAGLKALETAVAGVGEVHVVAPLNEQSGTSRALTLRHPLRYREAGPNRFAVEGTPTDSVMLALAHLLDFRPDLVISGINSGPNLGENIFYSGTVAAAAEGARHGIPAIALSVTERVNIDYLVIHFTLVVNQAILGLAPLAAKIGAIERGLSKASGGVH